MKTLKSAGKIFKSSETYQRVVTDTPTYYKKLQKIGLAAAGFGFAIKIGLAIFPATMPIGLAAIATELITHGIMVAGISQTVKK